MKKIILFSLVAMAALTASAGNSPYIARVYDYLPAPGQFVNVFPSYKPGYTQDSIIAQLETALCGKIGGTVSLGSYGGYIVFGFDHPVINKHGYDVKIHGNAIQSAAVPDQVGGSCEPGIIMVGVDMDGDGVPSEGDKWYEIKGADYDRCQHGYEVTYYKPDENKVQVPHASWRFISDIEYVHWTSHDQNPDSTSGYVWRNTFHTLHQTDFPAKGVDFYNLHSVSPAELLVVCLLQSLLPNAIPLGIVLVLRQLQLFFGNFAGIAQHMGSQRAVGIIPARFD